MGHRPEIPFAEILGKLANPSLSSSVSPTYQKARNHLCDSFHLHPDAICQARHSMVIAMSANRVHISFRGKGRTKKNRAEPTAKHSYGVFLPFIELRGFCYDDMMSMSVSSYGSTRGFKADVVLRLSHAYGALLHRHVATNWI